MRHPSKALASFVIGFSLDGGPGKLREVGSSILGRQITIEELLFMSFDAEIEAWTPPTLEERWSPVWGDIRARILERLPELGTLPPYEPPKESSEAARRYREGFAAGVEARFGPELELGP